MVNVEHGGSAGLSHSQVTSLLDAASAGRLPVLPSDFGRSTG